METRFNANRRSVESWVMLPGDVQLKLSTYHDRNRKQYSTILTRGTVRDGFVTTRLLEDSYSCAAVSVSRYNEKRMLEHHEGAKWLLTDPETLEWASNALEGWPSTQYGEPPETLSERNLGPLAAGSTAGGPDRGQPSLSARPSGQ